MSLKVLPCQRWNLPNFFVVKNYLYDCMQRFKLNDEKIMDFVRLLNLYSYLNSAMYC